MYYKQKEGEINIHTHTREKRKERKHKKQIKKATEIEMPRYWNRVKKMIQSKNTETQTMQSYCDALRIYKMYIQNQKAKT